MSYTHALNMYYIDMYICIVSKSVYICIQTYQITILILTVPVVELGLAYIYIYIVLPQNRTLNMYIAIYRADMHIRHVACSA